MTSTLTDEAAGAASADAASSDATRYTATIAAGTAPPTTRTSRSPRSLARSIVAVRESARASATRTTTKTLAARANVSTRNGVTTEDALPVRSRAASNEQQCELAERDANKENGRA